jgi:hypothetical protein
MYAITATVHFDKVRQQQRSMSIPTFFLDATVQGIVSEAHAITIAEDVINPFGHYRTSITAIKV